MQNMNKPSTIASAISSTVDIETVGKGSDSAMKDSNYKTTIQKTMSLSTVNTINLNYNLTIGKARQFLVLLIGDAILSC